MIKVFLKKINNSIHFIIEINIKMIVILIKDYENALHQNKNRILRKIWWLIIFFNKVRIILYQY